MKKHRVNRIMTFILVLALSVSTLLTGCGKNNDKIVLGWIGPLTGEMTIWGTAEMQALTMAVEDTNAAGGLLGKEVELKTYDNRGDAVETTKRRRKQSSKMDVSRCLVVIHRRARLRFQRSARSLISLRLQQRQQTAS